MYSQNNQTSHTSNLKSNLEKAILMIGLVVAIIVIKCTNATAQTYIGQNKKTQFSFVYPLGTNGTSMKFSNDYSFNMLVGMNGGVNKLELGGIGNFNIGMVKGFQLAGIANYTQGKVDGVQISGCANVNIGPTRGFQLSTLNVAHGEVTGTQVGVINYAKKLKGFQFGIINVVGDGAEALPIGIINVVKNGYYSLETTGGETLYANVNFKMGVEKFYTIFKVGYSTFNNNPIYSYGFGFGTLLNIADKHNLSIDLSANSIVYDDNWNSQWEDDENSGLNMLNKVDFSYQYKVTPKLSLLVGPSFNTYVTKVKVNDNFGTLNTPTTLYKDTNDNREISMWIGFNAGVSIQL